jgi:hypothetical protein
MPRVLYRTKYVKARPTMASLLSSEPHFSPETVTTRLCINAIGSELEFMNMEAAIAKLLIRHRHAISMSYERDRASVGSPLGPLQTEYPAQKKGDCHRYNSDNDEEDGYYP